MTLIPLIPSPLLLLLRVRPYFKATRPVTLGLLARFGILNFPTLLRPPLPFAVIYPRPAIEL